MFVWPGKSLPPPVTEAHNFEHIPWQKRAVQLIRSASISDYEAVASSFGIDPVALVTRVGLDVECLANPDLKIPIRKVDELLELSAETAGAENFGLRLSQNRSIAHLGPIGLLLRDEPDLRQFLLAIQRYIHLHNEALSVPVFWRGNTVIVALEYNVTNWTMQRQSMELAVGFLFRAMQAYMGDEWRPQRVCFRHARPRDDHDHNLLFGAQTHFLQTFDGLEFNFSEENSRRKTDPLMARYARQYLETLTVIRDDHFLTEVRNFVTMLLPTGRCSANSVAKSLNMECRTLQRRLAKAGCTFSEIVCTIRQDLVVKYLSQNSRTLLEITGLLGFVGQSAFSRWFRQKFGVTAQAWRSAYLKTHQNHD